MNFKAALSMIKANESLVVTFKKSKDKSKLAEHKNISDQMIKLSAKALYENISNSMTEFTKITLTSVEK